MLRRLRRRLAALIAPPDDWASLPPLPVVPPPRPPAPPAGSRRRGLGLLAEVLVDAARRGTPSPAEAVAEGGSPPAPLRGRAAFVAGWLDGRAVERIEAYLPEAGTIVVLGGDHLTVRLFSLKAPRRRVIVRPLRAGSLVVERDLPALSGTLAAAPRRHVESGRTATPPRSADRAGRGPSTASGPLEPVGEVGVAALVLLHVLRALPDEAAADLLARCHAALAPGGRLVVLERDVRPRWKYALALAAAGIARLGAGADGSGHGPARPRPTATWAELVQRAGFAPQIVPIDGPGLTPQTLIVGYREA